MKCKRSLQQIRAVVEIRSIESAEARHHAGEAERMLVEAEDRLERNRREADARAADWAEAGVAGALPIELDRCWRVEIARLDQDGADCDSAIASAAAERDRLARSWYRAEHRRDVVVGLAEDVLRAHRRKLDEARLAASEDRMAGSRKR